MSTNYKDHVSTLLSPCRGRQEQATCLNAFTHPECPPSSLTMSSSFIQLLSPYIPLTAEYFDVLPSSRLKRRFCNVSCILRYGIDEGGENEESKDQVSDNRDTSKWTALFQS